MIIGVLKETQKGDKRVAITPKITKQLIEKGFKVNVQEDAGANSSYKNSDYSKAGAKEPQRILWMPCPEFQELKTWMY